MRKLLTFMVAMFMATSFMQAASDVDLGDFEDQTTNVWGKWAGSWAIVANPVIASPNTSGYVLSYTPTAQWQGIQKDGLSINIADYSKLSFDVYAGATSVGIILNLFDGAGVKVDKYPSTTAGGWLHYELDFSTISTITSIAKIMLQNNTATLEVLYFDNIKFVAKPSAPPTSLTLTAAASSLTVGKKVSTTVSVVPTTSGSNVTYATSDATIATVNTTGIVTTLKAGTVDISAISTLNVLVGDTISITVTEPVASNSLVVANFENGIGNVDFWGGWNGITGGTPAPKTKIVNNPNTTGNSSAKVVKADSMNQWSALVTKPFDVNKYNKIKFKVYSDSAYADFQFEMGLNNGADIQKVSTSVGIVKQTWTEYEYNLTAFVTGNYKFYIKLASAKSIYPKVNFTHADSLGYHIYFDDIEFIAGDVASFVPITALAIQGTGSVNAITADNGTLQMEAVYTPTTATNKAIASWSLVSQNADTATLSATGLLTAVRNANVKVKAVSVDGSLVAEKVIAITGQKVGVDSIKIKPFSIAFPDTLTTNGASVRIDTIVKFYPKDATNKTIKWSVKGQTKNTVSATGLFEAFADGITWVIAVSDTNATAKDSIKIVVSGQQLDTMVTVSGTNDSILVNGGTMQMTATVLPATARIKDVNWSVSNTKATISATGLLQAANNGEVWVKATTIDGSNKSDSIKIIMINQISADSVVISGGSAITKNDSTLKLTATVYPATVSNKAVVWSIISADADTATISQNGLITPIRNGKITVKVASITDLTKFDTLVVNISGQIVPLRSIKVSAKDSTIKVNNGTLQIAVAFTPSDANNKTITWTVSDSTVASVSTSGLVTAIRDGKVWVKAVSVDGGFKDSLKVTTSNQVPFNIVTFEGPVPVGTKLVTINGKKYLQVVLKGWNSSFSVKPFNLRPGYTASCELKYSLCKATDDTLNLSDINGGINLQDTVNKIKNPWGAGLVPSATSLTQSPVTGSFGTASAAMSADMKLINQIQYFGQQKISWGATTGDTIWVSPISFVSNNPVVLDPAEVDPSDLPKGITIATIGDTKYFQVVLNGWNSSMSIIPVTLNSGLTAECSIKYSLCKASDDTLNLSDINGGINLQDTVNKVKNPWGEGMVPSSMSLTQSPVTGSLGNASGLMSADMKLINQIQFFGQQKISWGATTGDTIWISKITLKDKAAPTKPAALAAVADKSTVNLTWEASTDNVKLVGYIVSQGSVVLDTVSTLKFSVADLADGAYTFSVVALDASGNKSEAATANVSVTVSVAGSELANVTVYPNPVVNALRISGNANFKSVVIFNLDGKIVNRLENVATNSEINVSGLSSGMYMIRMTSASNAVVTKQFVKR